MGQRNHCRNPPLQIRKTPPMIARTMPDAKGDINMTAVFGGTCDIRATVRAPENQADRGNYGGGTTRACVTRLTVRCLKAKRWETST
jgi:hypothetical protein